MFCMKNINNPGFPAKQSWFNEQYKLGLRFKLLKNGFKEIDRKGRYELMITKKRPMTW